MENKTTPTTMEHYAPFRLVRDGAIIGVGTRPDCERMQTESGGKIEMFDRPKAASKVK